MHGASEGIVSLNGYRLLAEHACGTSFWFESRTRTRGVVARRLFCCLKGLSAIMEQLPRASQGLRWEEFRNNARERNGFVDVYKSWDGMSCAAWLLPEASERR